MFTSILDKFKHENDSHMPKANGISRRINGYLNQFVILTCFFDMQVKQKIRGQKIFPG